MSISIIADDILIPVKETRTNDGGVNFHLLLPTSYVLPKRTVVLSINPTTAVDAYLQEIVLARDLILTHLTPTTVTKLPFSFILQLHYLPHGRIDPITTTNTQVVPLRSFITTIKEWFDEIIITDPHSNYVTDTWPTEQWRFTIIPQHRCLLATVPDISVDDILVSCDTQPLKKVVEETGLICITPYRKTLVLPVLDSISNRYIIVVDIVDTGDTAVTLAEQLRNSGAHRIDLYATHGIFSQGLSKFVGLIDNLYIYQIVGTHLTMSDVNQYNAA